MKEEPLLLLSDLQKLINQVVLIDYTIIILGGNAMNPSISPMGNGCKLCAGCTGCMFCGPSAIAAAGAAGFVGFF